MIQAPTEKEIKAGFYEDVHNSFRNENVKHNFYAWLVIIKAMEPFSLKLESFRKALFQ